MTTFTDAVDQIMPNLLGGSALEIPLRQRAKYEGWFKIELAAALEANGFAVSLEKEYGLEKKYRADLAVNSDAEAKEILVMLKTANTNFRFNDVESRSRPITRNIKGIIEDIHKLGNLSAGYRGYVLFTVFPVAASQIERDTQLESHLARVKAAEITMVASAFVKRSTEWGVAWYLGEVRQVVTK